MGSKTVTGDNSHIGRTQLSSTYGDASTMDWAANCADMMPEYGSKVEFMLFERAGEKKWMWIYPLNTQRAKDRWMGGHDSQGDTDAEGIISQCKGSSMSSPTSSGSWRTG